MFLGFKKQKHLVLIFLKLGFFNKHSLETIFKIVCYRVFYFFFFFLNVSYHLSLVNLINGFESGSFKKLKKFFFEVT